MLSSRRRWWPQMPHVVPGAWSWPHARHDAARGGGASSSLSTTGGIVCGVCGGVGGDALRVILAYSGC